MNSLQVNDASVLRDLTRCLEPAEVFDGQGKLLGLFVPANLERAKQMYAKLEAMIDWDEIRRRGDASRERIPHAEVLARLKALEQEIQRRSEAGEKPLSVEQAKAFVHSVHLPPP